MTYSLQKIQIAMTTLAVTAIGSVQGEDLLVICCEEEICAPEPCCCGPYGHFFGNAGLLYLRAFEGGLSSPCDQTHIIDSNQNGLLVSRLQGNGNEPDFNWNLGFRIGVGYEFADSSCRIGAYWTHYNSHGRWKIDFDVVDVLFSCECDLSTCCVALIPFGGLRGANIDQKFRTHLVSRVQSVTGEETHTFSRGNFKEEFFGIGPLFGIEGVWDLFCQFSLYGDISLSFLYGTFNVRSDQTDEFATGKNINHLRNHTQACQTVLDAGFGVRWKAQFCHDRFLMLQLGLEQHLYFNQNQFYGYGDLSINGVSFAIGFEY